ncbi:MAG: competence protein ComFC [Pseudothermotoga sp.]|jgi:competence protein ComFC|uniref:ComF family protein n=1 Tax=Pseudothermotoga TaxID=1643951 RepID=UPI000747B037|nr:MULTISPECIES: ComF family protein [Pseudothermotoga]KUK22012.1 MAG: ComFC protein, putative [Pseudothermotoga lettingae]MDI3495621.1 competence protein ComFC [Pseudothermotoga sp.]
MVFPNKCLLCGKNIKITELLCQSCLSELFRGPVPLREKNEFFDVYFYGRYESMLKKLILAYKNGHHWRLYKLISQLLLKTITRYQHDADFVTWVPSSFSSLESRGFDTMGLIAKSIGKSLNIKVVKILDSYAKSTKKGMSVSERLALAKESFTYIRKMYGRFILIDDVYTTGSTVKECVNLLRKSGVQKVYVYCVARA